MRGGWTNGRAARSRRQRSEAAQACTGRRLTSGAQGWHPGPEGRSRSRRPGSRPGRRATQRLQRAGAGVRGGEGQKLHGGAGSTQQNVLRAASSGALRDGVQPNALMDGVCKGGRDLKWTRNTGDLSAQTLRQQLDRQCVLSRARCSDDGYQAG